MIKFIDQCYLPKNKILEKVKYYYSFWMLLLLFLNDVHVCGVFTHSHTLTQKIFN